MDLNKLIKIVEAAEQTHKDDNDSITMELTFGDSMIEFLEWVSEQAGFGTGITVTATTNGDEKYEFYIDGDGSDKIISIEKK